ncbi:phospholipase D-like domain-containing protein [Burkholderia aenigmatica]|uniref:phospholipase D-like domain-containing protein n=1 Tax=Burkholderia aenigmatica TaxID=2015348 RepID=UPI001F216E10|nr:phosphatidylserine/phosphatidylglycerophosphate/cardiolipin synthase family protein [Burkholderia aenigmatica]UKD17105.1 phospholipase D-like domain-containing protein [Burkholderia aenigmatica]
MTDDIKQPMPVAGAPTIQLGRQRVPGVLFVRDKLPPSDVGYHAQDTGRGDIEHVSTDDLSQSAHIRDLLIAQIRTASHKVLFCSFLFADDAVVQALCEAAERLQGGVYILTALGKHLRAEVLELDDEVTAQTAKQRERAQRHDEHLQRLARAGAWLRSAEDCHAKFCVVDDACAIVTSANSTKEAYEINPEDALVLHQPLAAREFGRLFAHIWQHLTTLESLPGSSLDVHSLPPPSVVQWRALTGTGDCHAVTTLRRYEASLLDAAVQVIDHAHHHLTIATYSFMGMEDHPVGAALQRALARGVGIDLLVQPRNHIEAQRYCLGWLLELAPDQVRIHGHRRTHTKSIVADEQIVLLWTGNLDARHGWHDGIEVGVVVEDPGVAAAVGRWTRNVMQRCTDTTLNAPPVRLLAEAGLPTALPGDWELWLPPKTSTGPLMGSLARHPVELMEAPGQQLLRSTDGWVMHIKVDAARRRLDVQHLQQAKGDGNGAARSKGWLANTELTIRVLPLPPAQQPARHKKRHRS